MWLQIINDQGETIFSKNYGGKDYDVATFLEQTFDKGFILSGTSKSFGAGESNVYIIKTNRLGVTLWTQNFGGNKNDYSYCIKQVGRRDFVFAGTSSSYGAGESDGWIVRFRTLKKKRK